MSRKKKESKKPFRGKKVYFSGSIRGGRDHKPRLYGDLIRFMKKGGADVLSEFVGVIGREERDRLFNKYVGGNPAGAEKPWVIARRVDFKWVDEAEYLVAEVTSPSLGVGMEIQRAIDKERLGFRRTKILCLCRQDVLENEGLSWMILGVTPNIHPDFYLIGYTTLKEAKEAIFQFLTDTLSRD
jgi:hypothetical protein